MPSAPIARRMLPRSLLGRSLLIILVPLVVVQGIALSIFYGTHLNLVSRRLSTAVAGEIAQTIDLMTRFPKPADHDWIMRSVWEHFSLQARLERGAKLPPEPHMNVLGPMDEDLAIALREQVHQSTNMDWKSDPQSILVHIQMPNGVLTIEIPRKRLYAETLFFFLAWLVGSALLLFGIAALFMRNQVRAIRRLAAAAEAFGMGREQGPIKPEGATEVRQAAAAFNRMRERITRFLTQRTIMLAGVSHDLRTPLTRLRLALAMMPATTTDQQQDLADMNADIDEMDRMIGGYLAFARDEGTEQARTMDLVAMLRDLVALNQRGGAKVDLTSAPNTFPLAIRPDAMRRAISNLIGNACRHAHHVAVTLTAQDRAVIITVEDDGPGIPPDQREQMFRAFESGADGGTGLGLTIARDIIRAHGGEITLHDAPRTGLIARVRLPL